MSASVSNENCVELKNLSISAISLFLWFKMLCIELNPAAPDAAWSLDGGDRWRFDALASSCNGFSASSTAKLSSLGFRDDDTGEES
jgi:hypothetical protein